MNEINISIPYSFFKDIFVKAFKYRLIPLCDEQAYISIENAKEYWILLDSKTRKELINISEFYPLFGGKREDVREFIEWAEKNIKAEHRKSLQRPLVDILPVVNLKQ